MTNKTQRRPQQQRGNGNNKGSSENIVDNIITILLIIGVLVGGFFYVKANNVSSVNDFLVSARGTFEKLKECGDTDDITGCISAAFKNQDHKEGAKNNNGNNDSNGVGNDDVESTLALLNSVRIAEAEDVDYDRADYKHWTVQDDGCTTREIALKTQGNNVVTAPNDDCKVVSGEWFDWYGGKETISEPSSTDLDHIIPLSYANAHGASEWSKEQKEEFANDLTQLLLVSAKENRTKSDKGASEYMPPNESYHCRYATRWVNTTSKYDLSITADDKQALEEALATC